MKIKLPIILDANDYHEFDIYKSLLNKVIELEEHEKHVGKDSVDFLEVGSNGKYLAFFYSNTMNVVNDDIVKILLEEQRSIFKTIKEVYDFLNENLYSTYLEDVNINLVIKDLEKDSEFFKKPKPRKNI